MTEKKESKEVKEIPNIKDKEKPEEKEKTEDKDKNKEIKDTRPMQSANVKLSQFPLGSSNDCKNLATQLSDTILGKLYRKDINRKDAWLFLNTLLPPLLDELDIVDTQLISQSVNTILQKKQQSTKKDKRKKNTKPQLGKKYQEKDQKKSSEGGAGTAGTAPIRTPVKQREREDDYNPDDFELFD